MDLTAAQALAGQLQSRVGRTGPLVQRRIEAGALIRFARATGQDDPLHLDEDAARAGPFGALLAPPTYVSTFCEEAMAGLVETDLPFAMFLHTDDCVTLGAPMLAGDLIRAQARYADAFVRESRHGPMLFQLLDMTLTNQHGAQVATLRVGTASFDVAAAAR